MLNADRIAQVRKKVAEVLYRAEQLYGLDMSQVAVRLDLRGRSAGQAGCRIGMGGKTYDHYIRLNISMINTVGFDHVFNETIPHEIAHVICYMNPSLGRNHDAGWRRVCQNLGGQGNRCHEQEVVFAKGNTYTYTTTTGHKVNMSQRRHRSIQMGVVYNVRGKGQISKACNWDRYVAAAETVAAPVENKPAERAPAAGTKADQIRAKIAVAKANGIDQETVIQFAIMVLGMSKSLAKTYVKNNWNRA